MNDKKSVAERLVEVAELCLFPTEMEADKYRANGGKFTVGLGAFTGFNFRTDKLEENRDIIRGFAVEILPDEFIRDDDDGLSWLGLENNRNGEAWGSPNHASVLIALCNALGLCEFCHDWHPQMINHPIAQANGMPFVRFSPNVR